MNWADESENSFPVVPGFPTLSALAPRPASTGSEEGQLEEIVAPNLHDDFQSWRSERSSLASVGELKQKQARLGTTYPAGGG